MGTLYLVSSFKFQDSGKEKPDFDKMTDQEVAVWYNDNVIYPDKVRINCYYYRHYSFIKDIQMIFCKFTVKAVLHFKV